jgi:hypothetical protein
MDPSPQKTPQGENIPRSFPPGGTWSGLAGQAGLELLSGQLFPGPDPLASAPARRAGGPGQPDDRGTEGEHDGEADVVRVGDPEHVRRDGQRARDACQRAPVGEVTAAGLDHRDVGAVIAQHVRKLLLGQRAGTPVPAQDRPQVPAGPGPLRRWQPRCRAGRTRAGHRRRRGELARRAARRPARG